MADSTHSSLNDSVRTDVSCRSPSLRVIPQLSKNGHMDISNKGIDRLPYSSNELYSKVKYLDISCNKIRCFDLDILSNFPICCSVDASQNILFQIKYTSAKLFSGLEWLNLSCNKLAKVDVLKKLHALKYLNLSHNRIEKFSLNISDFNKLTTLNLDSNRLKSFPDVRHLCNLRILSVNSNNIQTLEGVLAMLGGCKSLVVLDIGRNWICDLCELHYLTNLSACTDIRALTFSNNLCVEDQGREFNYRPFIYSCVLGNLSVIDGYCITEAEILKGEWLHTQGKSRNFKPKTSSHKALCAYLTKECPAEANLLLSKLDDPLTNRIKRVMKKRREYQNSNATNDIALNESTGPLDFSIPPFSPTNMWRRDEDISPTKRPGSNTSSSTVIISCSESNSVPQPDITAKLSDNFMKATESLCLFSAESSSMTFVGVDEPPISSSRRLTNSPESFRSRNLDESYTSIASTSTFPESKHLDNITEAKSDVEYNYNGISCTSTPKIPTQESKSDFPLSVQDVNESGFEHPFQTISLASCKRIGVDESSDNFSSHVQNAHVNEKIENVEQNGNEEIEVEKSIKDVLVTDSTQTSDSSSPLMMNRTRIISSKDTINQSAVTRDEFDALRKQVGELVKENSLLTEINEQLAQTIMELKHHVDNRQTFENEVLRTLIPAPVCLKYQRRSDESLLITWENIIPLLSMVKGYEVLLNGVPSGIVTARQKRLVVTEIHPDERYTMSIRAISDFKNLRSIEATILIPKMEEDENENKENVTQTEKK